jgi:hypothetical protein
MFAGVERAVVQHLLVGGSGPEIFRFNAWISDFGRGPGAGQRVHADGAEVAMPAKSLGTDAWVIGSNRAASGMAAIGPPFL